MFTEQTVAIGKWVYTRPSVDPSKGKSMFTEQTLVIGNCD